LAVFVIVTAVAVKLVAGSGSAPVDEAGPTFGATSAAPDAPSSDPAPAPPSAPEVNLVHPTIAPASARVEGKPDATAQVAALTSALGPTGVSIAVLNTVTGKSFTYGATGAMNTGSIVKLDILETLLLQHEDAHTALTSTEAAEATTMIENSDNNAAQALWVDVGSDPAVTIANKRLGPVDTVAGTDDYWGLTTTDGADQVALLKNLVGSGGPLDAASKAFALSLMDNVEADQRWGVGVIADPGTTFANKNGWLAVDDDNERWLVNSDGIVTVHGQQVLISVLTQHDASEAAGITLVQQLAQAVAPAVT
jgi:Beta-lactamase enzyme family